MSHHARSDEFRPDPAEQPSGSSTTSGGTLGRSTRRLRARGCVHFGRWTRISSGSSAEIGVTRCDSRDKRVVLGRREHLNCVLDRETTPQGNAGDIHITARAHRDPGNLLSPGGGRAVTQVSGVDEGRPVRRELGDDSTPTARDGRTR